LVSSDPVGNLSPTQTVSVLLLEESPSGSWCQPLLLIVVCWHHVGHLIAPRLSLVVGRHNWDSLPTSDCLTQLSLTVLLGDGVLKQHATLHSSHLAVHGSPLVAVEAKATARIHATHNTHVHHSSLLLSELLLDALTSSLHVLIHKSRVEHCVALRVGWGHVEATHEATEALISSSCTEVSIIHHHFFADLVSYAVTITLNLVYFLIINFFYRPPNLRI
jgi:hypothetical protein